MYLELDGEGPLHAQLTRALKAAMRAGRCGGPRLPPTRLLAQELGLSRNTVLAAYEQLRAEGFIDGRTGSGSYIAQPLPAAPAAGPVIPHEIGPQSVRARRMRDCHDHSAIPGRDVPGAVHSFQYGVPMTNPALTTAWARELSRAAQYTSPKYPPSQGLLALREATCDYLARRRGVHVSPQDILIVGGTQQAISLVADVLLDPGDAVAIEEPHYDAIRKVLLSRGASMQAVGVDAQGLVVDEVAQRCPKLVCVTPSHQFPTGAVMSLRRRRELLGHASRTGAWIFEDDYDGEFRYEGKPLPALRSLDHEHRVIYVGTFSKVLFPALRLGYLVMPPQLRRDFIAAKWMADFSSPGIEQAALAHFIASGGFERHLRLTAQQLKLRREALIDGLRTCGRGRLQVEDSQAGMHLVVWLPGRSDAEVDALVRHAQEIGLGLYSIAPYYLRPQDRGGLLMGFGGLSVPQIEQALALFRQSLDAIFPLVSAMRPPQRPVQRPTMRNRRGRSRAS